MILNVEFKEIDRKFNADFGEVHNISDGGYERGYAEGYAEGDAEGYNRGHTEGDAEGYNRGYNDGEAAGYNKGFEDGNENSETDIVDGLINGTSKIEIYNDRITKVRQYAFFFHKSVLSIDFPNVISVDSNAFQYSTIEEANLPNMKTNSYNAFESTLLKVVDFPKLEEIGNQSFTSCKALTRARFSSAKTIGANAFSNCSALTEVILEANKVCTLSNTSAFKNSAIANGTGFIYVPDNLVEQYKAATNWATYASQIKGISELAGG